MKTRWAAHRRCADALREAEEEGEGERAGEGPLCGGAVVCGEDTREGRSSAQHSTREQCSNAGRQAPLPQPLRAFTHQSRVERGEPLRSNPLHCIWGAVSACGSGGEKRGGDAER